MMNYFDTRVKLIFVTLRNASNIKEALARQAKEFQSQIKLIRASLFFKEPYCVVVRQQQIAFLPLGES